MVMAVATRGICIDIDTKECGFAAQSPVCPKLVSPPFRKKNHIMDINQTSMPFSFFLTYISSNFNPGATMLVKHIS
jgi:hypothetical protein